MKSGLIVTSIFILLAGALKYSGLDYSYAQLVGVPVIIWIFVKVLPKPFSISANVGVLVFLCAFMGVGVSYNIELLKIGGVSVARFADDPIENQSRIFRAQLGGIFERLSMDSEVVRYPTKIKGKKAAFKLMRKEKRSGVVWGNSQMLSVVFRAPSNSTLADIIGAGVNKFGLKELPEFYLARSVNDIKITWGPSIPADVFISYIFAAFESSSLSRRESLLGQAYSIEGPWKWMDHRAYPYWLQGTQHILDAIDGEFEPGELDCADTLLRKAASFLVVSDSNPELLSAIYNNHAIVVYLRAELQNRPRLRERYLSEFKRAAERRVRNKDSQLSQNIKLAAMSNLNLFDEDKIINPKKGKLHGAKRKH